MSVDFNKIYLDKSINVNRSNQSALCFVDGKIISKSKYSILNNILTLFNIAHSDITFIHANGIATVYEFEARLYQNNIQLSTTDKNLQDVDNLIYDNLLVFIDGVLQSKSEYRVLENKILTFNTAYTNDPNQVFNIIVYASNQSFIRKEIPIKTSPIITRTFSNEENRTISDIQSFLDDVSLDSAYDLNNTILFKNGQKINFNDISQPHSEKNHIKLNIAETGIERLEYIQFVTQTGSSSTKSCNFNAQAGYLSYGPFDDFNKKIPILYDVIVTFPEQVKLIIDNPREGMFIKETDGYGELLIIDNNFETRSIKCKAIQNFKQITYTADEYYLEVPKATSIVKYLAEYDKKFTFLPEILEIFQRLLLDEMQDSIDRLRNIRSISKVDSIHINKLLSLLGFNLNIKELTIKQRRELLEELTEFYRRVGTRDSYNLVNILQNDLKLINMEQLFTPHYPQPRTAVDKIYDYTIDEISGGTGYSVGDFLVVQGTDLSGTVSEVDSNGAIKGFELTTEEGYSQYILDDRELSSGVEANFKVTSSPSTYDYDWTITESAGYKVGQRLVTPDELYSIVVKQVSNSGEILDFEESITKGSSAISINAVSLYLDNQKLSLRVTSSPKETSSSAIVFRGQNGGEVQNIYLQRGYYKIIMSGGGGAGGASDTSRGSNYDAPATNGESGEYVEKYFAITESGANVTCWVGQGGGRVKAKASDWASYWSDVGGNGYHAGKKGNGRVWQARYSYGVATAGQGGGSSAVIVNNKLVAEARGGNGGQVQWFDGWKEGEWRTIPGGIGGGGGIVNGGGAAGGNRSGNDFWSKNGADGYIEIHSVESAYTTQVLGDSTGIAVGDKFTSIDSNVEFTVVSKTKDGNGNTTFEVTPTLGDIPVTGTFKLNPVDTNIKIAKLSIASKIIEYAYDVTVATPATYLRENDTFITSYDGIEFKYVVAQDKDIKGSYSPLTGTKDINFQKIVGLSNIGQDARISITSSSNEQKTEDREYIDFYTPKELGAEEKKEYRIGSIDYGLITEGTPNSPFPWEVGEPDIDYMYISIDAVKSINYGEITDNILGEWVYWLQWDRNPQWYPTNHVEVELKMPSGVNLDNYTNVFAEQFYELSSAVLYIHRLIQSFYAGNDVSNSNTPIIKDDKGNIIGVTGAPFGIMNGPIYQTEWIALTSDPRRQAAN